MKHSDQWELVRFDWATLENGRVGNVCKLNESQGSFAHKNSRIPANGHWVRSCYVYSVTLGGRFHDRFDAFDCKPDH